MKCIIVLVIKICTEYCMPHVAPVFISILFAYLYCIFLALTCIQSHCTVHAWWSSLCTLNCCMHLSSPSFELLQSCTGINSLSLITWLHYWSIFFWQSALVGLFELGIFTWIGLVAVCMSSCTLLSYITLIKCEMLHVASYHALVVCIPYLCSYNMNRPLKPYVILLFES